MRVRKVSLNSIRPIIIAGMLFTDIMGNFQILVEFPGRSKMFNKYYDNTVSVRQVKSDVIQELGLSYKEILELKISKDDGPLSDDELLNDVTALIGYVKLSNEG